MHTKEHPVSSQNDNSGQGDPWGRGTSPGPDFEDLIRRGQDRLKQFMPSGSPRGAIVLGGREIELGQKASAPLASFI